MIKPKQRRCIRTDVTMCNFRTLCIFFLHCTLYIVRVCTLSGNRRSSPERNYTVKSSEAIVCSIPHIQKKQEYLFFCVVSHYFHRHPVEFKTPRNYVEMFLEVSFSYNNLFNPRTIQYHTEVYEWVIYTYKYEKQLVLFYLLDVLCIKLPIQGVWLNWIEH